jgi:hypothetical protein
MMAWSLVIAGVVAGWVIAMLIVVEIFRCLAAGNRLADEGVAQALKDLDAARERDRVDKGWQG